MGINLMRSSGLPTILDIVCPVQDLFVLTLHIVCGGVPTGLLH